MQNKTTVIEIRTAFTSEGAVGVFMCKVHKRTFWSSKNVVS